MENTVTPQENKMGVMPINKLLISMSLPMMASMLVQALYNIVDSVFIARLGEDPLAALTLASPIQNLMIAIASGTAVGINALLSRSLGEKNSEEASNAANNGVFLGFLSFCLFLIFGLFFTRMYFEAQTDIQSIIDYGYSYLSICSIFSFGIFGQVIFERILQSTGKTFYTMFTQGLGAIINIILDPILIFGYLGFPAMGVAGAAVATVIGQICAMILAIIFNLKKNNEVSLSLKGFRPKGGTIKRIYSVGIPSIIMMSIGSVMLIGMNRILLKFSSTAVAVLGIYFRLQSFIFMPVFGLNNGMVPILAYNYGARNRERMVKVIKLSITYAVTLMIIGLLLFQIFPDLLLSIFKVEDSSDLIPVGRVALRYISLSFLFAGFCIVAGSVFQALGRGTLSLIVSVTRQLIVLLPAAYILSLFGNLDLIWLSFPIAEIFSLIFSAFFLKHTYSKIIRPIPLAGNAENPV